jgi:hypothetical protein
MHTNKLLQRGRYIVEGTVVPALEDDIISKIGFHFYYFVVRTGKLIFGEMRNI